MVLVHIYCKLICSCLCSSEQNNNPPPGRTTMKGLFLWQKEDCVKVRKVSWCVAGWSSVAGSSSYLWRRSSMLEHPVAGNRREVFFHWFADRLPKKTRKNSSLEEDGINALCPLIGPCLAESLGRQGHWFVKENRSVTATDQIRKVIFGIKYLELILSSIYSPNLLV